MIVYVKCRGIWSPPERKPSVAVLSPKTSEQVEPNTTASPRRVNRTRLRLVLWLGRSFVPNGYFNRWIFAVTAPFGVSMRAK